MPVFPYSLGIGILLCLAIEAAEGSDVQQLIGQRFAAHDTVQRGDEDNQDARDCLQGLNWPSAAFEVCVEAPAHSGQGDALVRFPSPMPTEEQSTVDAFLEWYMVRSPSGEILDRPTVIVIHESGRNMPVGRLVAAGFRQRGIHAFLLHLPGYGQRRFSQPKAHLTHLSSIRQGVADARRARDAAAVLPGVAKDQVSLQGTSLGGFVAATTAGIDRSYTNVFLVLSGGDIFGVIQNGRKDAERYRRAALEAGLTEEELQALAWQIEPNRLAHRVDPEHTWLYSGVFDDVVPIENARSFVRAAQLPVAHHQLMPVDHYTGILLLPAVLDRMTTVMMSSFDPENPAP